MLDSIDNGEAKAAWVARVLGITVPTRYSDTHANQAAPALDPAEVRGRLNEVGLRVRDSHAHPDIAALSARFAAAVAALRGGDLAATETLLDEIETGLAKGAASARAGEVPPAGPGMSLRQAAEASLAWRRACARAATEIPALKAAILASLSADPNFDDDDLEDATEELDALDIVPSLFDEALADTVDDLINAQPAQRLALRDRLFGLIDEQLERLDGDELLGAIPGNEFHAVDLAGPARAALETLRSALAG